MLSDLRKRKADVVVVWALDRLARSLKHLLTIAEECRLLGVDLVSLRQNIDSTLPAGRLTFQVLGASRSSSGRCCATGSRQGWPRHVGQASEWGVQHGVNFTLRTLSG